jgi:hypothetical protein
MDDVSGRALSGHWASSNNLNESWNMTDWNLIGWLLNFNILIRHKFTLFDLKNKHTFDLILNTFLTRALNLWGELFCIDDLINLKPASITSIDSNMHAWFDITASSDDTFHSHKSSD